MFIFIAAIYSLSISVLAQAVKFPVSVAFTVEEKDLIPEGITYDPGTHRFFISSINKEKVVAIREKGAATDFLKAGQDGILQTLGMKIDVMKRRLWVVSNKSTNDSHASSVHIFDIESGLLIKKFTLPDDTIHLLNDLALTGGGDAFITDSFSDVIYTVPADLSGLKLFVKPDPLLKSANGLTVSPDNNILYVATGAGITLINLKTLEIKPIRKPENINASGIDGLVYYKGSLIGVVNSREDESDMFIAKYKLSPDLQEISEVAVIDKGNPLFNFPTTCVIAEGYLYCLANTSLRTFFLKEMNFEKKLHNPVILKYKLTE